MTAPGRALSVELCTDERTFAALAEEWGRLHASCPSATPFQTHAWLHSWWLSYGTPDGLRLFLVRRGGELVGAAPLMRVRRPLPKLVPIGGAISDFRDVLLDAEVTEEGSLVLADALSDAARTALIDFRDVRPGSAVERIYRHWQGPRCRLRDSTCLELPALPMTELVKRLPTARAQRVRNKVNRLGRLGVEWRVVNHDETETALRRMLELHQLQWQDKKVTPEHIRPRFLEHLVRSVGPMTRSGQAAVTEFLFEGTVVAVNLLLLSGGLTGEYLYGFHPRLRESKLDVATMLLRASSEVASGREGGVLSLLRGDEPYKYRWCPETVHNQRFLLAGRRTVPLLAASACHSGARHGAKKVLRRKAAAQDQG
ncbi:MULTISPECIES: GNAT family N-acetyltransferase [unclassified Streptomyces]|uniref:GNAT family N-acetyltransferase n=1 Tax=unclassified Streptomyces TaxID=2593676 RepID=UPI00224CA4EB|nr:MULTISPECIES: GNAT family N-acetyltransferase [unclassified Streptomyces]MCX4880913.1 GNAT family N-acetyltransferase [Streptomyces sp. NBC_00847]MCX5420953.1 GNAT family N-acetyltransferase [Streptomyces sp. NBC_00078]